MSNKYDDGESRLNEYEVVKKIGNGRFGEVFLVKHKRTQEFFCWKAISYRGLKEREKSQLVIEVNVMRELKHKNIVRYIDRFLNKANQKLYILMEFCDAGDLSRNIQKCYKMFGKIEEHAVLDITRQLLHALAYCHNLKDGPNGERVLHRDLKPQNIFLSTGIRHIGKITAQANNLTSRPIAKIGDFGLSKNIGIESMAHSCVGTPYYWSPELLLHETKSYDDKSDMWALGCIIYELCSGKTPFHKANNFAQLVSELKKGPELPIKGKSKELNMLIQSLLHLSPKERPSALQCLGFQIIKQISPPVNRKESITDQGRRENPNRMEGGGPYSPSSQSSVISKRNEERERSSSRVSRQGISDVNKDMGKYTPEVPKSHYRINGQYAVEGGQMYYNVEKERLTEKEKMKRELLEREQMERNRKEKENAQRKAVEMNLMEQKRIDREKMERLERERIERMGRERMEKVERERKELERERISRERLDRERMERERLDRERLDRERLDRERLDRERLDRERLDRERLERVRQERLEREHKDRGRIERDRLERERERERAERDGIDRFEREKAEKERREQYYMREAQGNSKLEAMAKMRLHSKNSENYSSSRVKEKYEQVKKMKNYPYDTNDETNIRSNMKPGLYTDDDDDHNIPVRLEKRDRDRDRESYLRSHSASSITSKQMPKYNNAPALTPTPTSKNYYPRENLCNIPVSPTSRSQYSNTSADNPHYKNMVREQRNISTASAAVDVLKHPKEVYKGSNANIPYKGSKYDREFLEKGYMEEGGNGCKSSRVSNMYFNENARRSSSVMTHVNGNASRNRSGTVLRPNIEHEKGNIEENRAFKNLEMDREYLLEKKKLLLEKEKELYGRIKPAGAYDYPPVQRQDQYEHTKTLEKNNAHSSRRNTSVSVNRVPSENRSSYRIKNEPLARNEDYYMAKNRNVYGAQKAGRNEKYESGAYTCR